LLKVEKKFYIDKRVDIAFSLRNSKYISLFLIIGALNIAYFRIYLGNLFLDPAIHIFSAVLLLPSLILVFSSKVFFDIELITKQPFEASKILIGFIACSIFPELFLPYYLIIHQYKNNLYKMPVENFGDTDQKLNTHLSMVFGVCLAFVGIDYFQEFFYSIAMGTISSHYFLAAKEKIKYNWQNINKLKNLVFCSKEQLNWRIIENNRLINFISNTSLFAMILQLLSPLLLFPGFVVYKYQLFLMICALIGFHFLVFVSSGLNFWKWAITLAAMSILTISLSFEEYATSPVYHLLYISSFIYGAFVSKIPIGLGWLDSPLNKVYKIYFKYENDDTPYRVRPRHIYPWDILISQNRFSFLTPRKKFITGCLGAIRNQEECNFLNRISESEEEQNIEAAVMSLVNARGKSKIELSSAHHVQNQVNSFISFLIVVSKIKVENRTLFSGILDHTFVHIRDAREEEATLCDKDHENMNLEKVIIDFKRTFYSEKLNKIIDFDKETIEIQTSRR